MLISALVIEMLPKCIASCSFSVLFSNCMVFILKVIFFRKVQFGPLLSNISETVHAMTNFICSINTKTYMILQFTFWPLMTLKCQIKVTEQKWLYLFNGVYHQSFIEFI